MGKFRPAVARLVVAALALMALPLAIPSQKAYSAPAHWAEQVLSEAAYRGIVTGYPDGSIQPDRPVSRAEVCTMLVRMLGEQEAADTAMRLFSSFVDVNVNYWAKGYLEVAREKGIFLGDSGDLAAPDRSVTRAEAVTMLDRCATSLGLTLADAIKPAFPDSSQIPAWASSSVARLSSAGVVLGDPDGRFYPSRGLTRAEAATLTLRLLALMGRRWDLAGAYGGLSPARTEIYVDCQGQRLSVPVAASPDVFTSGSRSDLASLVLGSRVGVIIVSGSVRLVAEIT